MSTTQKRIVICNPRARFGGGESAVDEVARLLRPRGLSAEIIAAEGWEGTREAARAAAEAGYQQVVAAGGDGTVNAVANGIAGRAAALGILPRGTGNVLAHNLGVAELGAALEALAGGREREIDLGCLDERGFVAVAGVGMDAEITRRVDPNWKYHLGRLAFVGEWVRTRIEQQPHVFRVVLRGEEERVIEEPMWAALILNVPNFTFGLPLTRSGSLSDGWLEVALFRDAGGWQFFYGLTQILSKMGDVGDLPGVSVHRIQAATVAVEPPWGWEVDGDPVGTTPVEVSVRPRALRVIEG